MIINWSTKLNIKLIVFITSTTNNIIGLFSSYQPEDGQIKQLKTEQNYVHVDDL